jgi:hypothetical protein
MMPKRFAAAFVNEGFAPRSLNASGNTENRVDVL